MKFDSSGVAAVKARAGIAEVVGRYVQLRSVGGRLVGVCPFHQETKGSFNVHPEKGFFHCFGCQASGDVIDFYCRINGLEFREGLERLASEFGVDLGRTTSDPRAAAKKRLRDDCLAMHALAERFFRDTLGGPAGAAAREYLKRRAVSSEMVERFALGVSPGEWHGLETVLKAKGFSVDSGVTAGLLSVGREGRVWDRFRERLMFPIRDGGGRVVAFGGRIMGEGDPKYLNSAETPIYTKGQHLYGLFEAKPRLAKTKRALLCEGYLDVITLHQFGYAEACGVLGTAMTEEQARKLCGFSPKVDLVFDGDAAGRKAALRAAQMLLSLGAACRVVPMPDGEDVDSLLHAQGTAAFDACLARAEDGLTYCLRTVREQYAPREMAAWAADFLSALKDEGLRSVFIPRVAAGLSLAEPELRNALFAAQSGRGSAAAAGRAAARPEAFTLSGSDAELLGFAVRHPEYLSALAEQGVAACLSGAPARDFFGKLAGCGPDELVTLLTEAQKAFWARAQLAPPLDAQAAASHFEEICAFLRDLRSKEQRRSLKAAIRRAQEQGEREEALRLLTELQALTGRSDE